MFLIFGLILNFNKLKLFTRLELSKSRSIKNNSCLFKFKLNKQKIRLD